jgi:hypothetical protein
VCEREGGGAIGGLFSSPSVKVVAEPLRLMAVERDEAKTRRCALKQTILTTVNNKLTMKYSPWTMVLRAIKKMDRWANSKATSQSLSAKMLGRMGVGPGWGGVIEQ